MKTIHYNVHLLFTPSCVYSMGLPQINLIMVGATMPSTSFGSTRTALGIRRSAPAVKSPPFPVSTMRPTPWQSRATARFWWLANQLIRVPNNLLDSDCSD